MPHRQQRGAAAGSARGLGGSSDASAALLIEAIETVGRELRSSVPPPRGAPFYALDYAAGDLSPLDALCSRGIFRKYEHALHLGAGLGGPARWWATHFGCSVLGVECVAGRARAAAQLTRRAGLTTQVRFLAADATALPVRERIFTHVWASDALRTMADPLAALREAWRVLRPGAQFGLHVRVTDADSIGAAEWCERLAVVGFVDVDSQPAAVPQVSQVVHLARRRLDRVLRAHSAPQASQAAADYVAACEAAASQGERALIFARRPA